jgi:hypothetical protein
LKSLNCCKKNIWPICFQLVMKWDFLDVGSLFLLGCTDIMKCQNPSSVYLSENFLPLEQIFLQFNIFLKIIPNGDWRWWDKTKYDIDSPHFQTLFMM